MTEFDMEVSKRKRAKTQTEKRIRETLTFALAHYSLDNFQLMETVREIYARIQKTYEEYADELVEKPKISEKFQECIGNLLVEVKDIENNVVADVQDALTLAYNEGAYVINGDKEDINYKKVLNDVEESQDLISKSAQKIGDVVTELSVFKDEFESDEGLILVAKISQICEELLEAIGVNSDNDLILSLVALKAISEKKG